MAILWSVFYAHYSPILTIRTVFRMIFLDFFAVGLVVSTALWFVIPNHSIERALTIVRCAGLSLINSSLTLRRIRHHKPSNGLTATTSPSILSSRFSSSVLPSSVHSLYLISPSNYRLTFCFEFCSNST